MTAQTFPRQGARPAVPATRVLAFARSVPWRRLLADGARGFAVGLLVLGLVAAALAGQGLHTRILLLDWTIGVGLVVLPVLALHVVLRVATALVVRVLEAVARRVRPTRARALTAPVALLRFVGGFLFASTIAISVVIWASTEGSALEMFHALFFYEILIVTGAVVGLLLGLAWGARPLWHGGRPRAAALALAPAVALGVSVAGWAVLPGAGDPIVREPAAALAVIAPLDLPDPGRPGPYRVIAATYGSGGGPRPEFAGEADWRTPTVDASGALAARPGISGLYADWVLGVEPARIPLNGLVWYPADATGRLPIVLIVHGNHDAGEPSDPGYADLAAHLASRGMIAVSVDQNFLNGDPFFDYDGAEQGVRAWLLLRHLEQFRAWHAEYGHPLAGRVDLGRVALIGHSRGGEAAAVAAMLEADEDLAVLPGALPVPHDLGIRAVIALAPSTAQYVGPGAPVHLTDVDYLVMQGAHDADVIGFAGLQTYHRVSFTGPGDHLKVALFSQRANHGRFNSVWDIGDAGVLSSWMLDRGSILTLADQQRLARSVIGAFLARSLQGETAYDAFFREPRSGAAWLPDDVVETHWQSSRRVAPSTTATTAGFSRSGARDPRLRDGSQQGDAAAWLAWEGEAGYAIAIDAALRAEIDRGDSLVFSLASAESANLAVDPVVELGYQSGATVAVRLSEVAPLRPLFGTRLWKVDGLGDRYAPTERPVIPVERFLQTYEIPLAAFAVPVPRPGGLPAGLERVTIRFSGAGSAFLDDLGFEPGVAGLASRAEVEPGR